VSALRKNWIILALLTAVSLLNDYVGIGIQNHLVQIPVILKIHDPTLYQYGLYGEALQRYYSLYWKLVAIVSKYVGITPCLVILHVLCRGILFTGIFSLGYSLYRKTSIALTGVLLAVFGLRTILATLTLLQIILLLTQVLPWHCRFGQ
jgi:hypothetical protein